MRLIRTKLKPDLIELLGEIAAQHSIEDKGFSEDLFCLVRKRGSGLPADDRLEKMATAIAQRMNKNRTLTLLSLRKRRHVLRMLTELPYFQALCLELAANPHQAVARLFSTFREMTRKIRQAQCLTCHLRTSCNFGMQYGGVVSDIGRVVDADFAKKVHVDCPERPEIDSINQLAAFAQKFAAISPVSLGSTQAQTVEDYEKAMKELGEEMEGEAMEEDGSMSDLDPEESANDAAASLGVGGAGRTDLGCSATSTGAHFARVNEALVNQMSTANMVLFEIGLKLQALLGAATQNKYKPAPAVADKSDIKNLSSTTEMTSVAPSQQALNDDEFAVRLAKGSLQVTKYEEPEEKKFLLYGLIDVSGSMRDNIGANSGGWSLISRGQVASTLATALFSRVRDEEGIVFLRFFDDAPGMMLSARKKPEFEPLLKEIATNDFNGGGTSIARALLQAVRDVRDSQNEIRKAEILLITDGDDTIDAKAEKEIVEIKTKYDIRLNSLNINPSGHQHGNAAEVMKRISTKYLKINPSTVNVSQFVELVT